MEETLIAGVYQAFSSFTAAALMLPVIAMMYVLHLRGGHRHRTDGLYEQTAG